MKASSYMMRRAAAGWSRVCYGLDLSSDPPVIVRGERAAAGIQFKTLPPGDRSYALPGSVVSVCMSERESFVRWLEAPFASRRKAAQVYPSLLDIQLPFPVESCVCDFIPAPGPRTVSSRALAVGARIADVEKKLAACRAAGSDPAVVDQEGLALWSGTVGEVAPADAAVRVLVLLQGTRATVVTGRGGEFVSSHSVKPAAAEISRVLHAAFQQPPTAVEWAWAGPGSAAAGPAASLAAALLVDWPGRSFTHDDPASFLARSLARRAMTDGPVRCNLRSGALKHPILVAREARASRNVAILLLAGGLAVALLGITTNLAAGKMLERTRTGLEKTIDDIAGYHVTAKGDKALAAVDQALRKSGGRNRPFAEAFEPSLAGYLRNIVAAGKANGMVFSRIEIRRDSVLLTGSAKDWEQCEKFCAVLGGMGYQARAIKEASSGGRVQFRISAGDRR